MYIVKVQFCNGEIEIVGRYDDKKVAEKRAEQAGDFCRDYGGEVLPF